MDPQENSELDRKNAEEPAPSMKIKIKPKVRIVENGSTEVPASSTSTNYGGSIVQSMGGGTVACSIGSATASASISSTINQTIASEPMAMPQPTLRLVLRRPDTTRRVTFHVDVVDNENMNRRKSKCCCIYNKPHPFGESSSETDDECEHCFGHPEVRAENRQRKMKAACGCGCRGGHTHSDATELVSEEQGTSGSQAEYQTSAQHTADDPDGEAQEMPAIVEEPKLVEFPEISAKQKQHKGEEDTLS
ncbi:type 1 phosphatases regulator YPI1 [Drosophila guanche]|uniref:E3 ubiquitin-protein ligase PPP1R11 n=1 Tax=Drosophila guanche TaxID=7266 RepID=A0A3B0KRZ5_DROGU|nr:type 1 phosphatases regulator YPI1 [Drosophila guanche]SPP86698.1 blast:Protein phosphatase 1 regulatory subunit 11 [Drosophila guanche]